MLTGSRGSCSRKAYPTTSPCTAIAGPGLRSCGPVMAALCPGTSRRSSAGNSTGTTGTPAPLLNLKGVGPEFAAVLWSEGLYRHFDNPRQVAAYAGLAPTPWQSGTIDREQGVSKAGNPRLRATMIQLAWLWLRHQPDSLLTRWFHDRVMQNGGRVRKTAITALARKLLVAFWKYVTAGVVIEGAMMTA